MYTATVRGRPGDTTATGPAMTRELTRLFKRAGRHPAKLQGRERNRIGLLAVGRHGALLKLVESDGARDERLGQALVVSPATAKTHVSRVMSKLNARDRAQLVVIAYESGLVQPGG